MMDDTCDLGVRWDWGQERVGRHSEATTKRRLHSVSDDTARQPLNEDSTACRTTQRGNH